MRSSVCRGFLFGSVYTAQRCTAGYVWCWQALQMCWDGFFIEDENYRSDFFAYALHPCLRQVQGETLTAIKW